MEFLETLNPVQKEAVTFGDGPLLILAGAGSGKTRVLTARVAWLVLERGVPPENILAVTFTNKAAGEMRERLKPLIGPRARDLWLGTFHSLGLRILKSEYASIGAARLTVYNDDDQLQLVKQVMSDLGISDKSYPAKSVLARINQAKNENIGPEEFLRYGRDFLTERTAKVYSLYQKRLMEMNCRDFGDLICEPIRLIKGNPGLLRKYRERFFYVLVDEYQDTNRAQYLLTQILSSGTRNLLAVGDPDQSIYAWRGADITNILDFEKDYPDSTVLRLEQNYRSTKTILAAANSVIKNNKGRLDKDLWTENHEGDEIVYEEARDEKDEARSVIARIREFSRGGVSYRDMAVFYRTNAQSRVFEEELIREGIPYAVVGGVRFYDRMEIRDAIAYLRAAVNPGDELSIARIINTPPRGVGKATFEKVRALAAERKIALFDAFRVARTGGLFSKTKLDRLLDAYEDFSKGLGARPLHELTLRLLEDSGYMMMWQEEGTEEAFERVGNLFEFISAIKDFEAANPGSTVNDFLDHVSLISDIDGYDEGSERLTLMTIHSAKGLEFRCVFITGMEEGLFPHSRSSDDPEGLEEERRLCYVGMTRARERLLLFSARTRNVYGDVRYQMRSRFLDEVPAELIRWKEADSSFTTGGAYREGSNFGTGAFGTVGKKKEVYVSDEPYYTSEDSQVEASGGGFRAGMRVRHPSFGVGVIKESSGRGKDAKVTVKFDSGTKKLAVKYAGLVPEG